MSEDADLIGEILCEAEGDPGDVAAGSEDGSDSKASKSAADRLVDLAQERYRFGCTEDGEAYALARPGGHVVRTLRGGQVSLRAELASAYRAAHRKVAPQQALADALLVLEGIAQEAEPEPVHLRVATDDAGQVWLDLGDKAERAVRVGVDGWQVVERGIPVLFRRTKLTGALPVPASGGDLGELWELLNVAEADRPLVLAWLVAAVIAPDIPHPVLTLFGEQGTGKSSASRLLVSLIDPSPVPLRKPPKDPESWVTAAAGSWVVGLDNLSAVAPWFSDSLCRAATGEGDVRRALYTDGGLAVFAFRRCILLNGIDVGALRGDLADRAIVVDLDRLNETQRRTESELAATWQEAFPRILGGLLTECSECRFALPSLRLGSSPRMADFAHILAAIDARHGTQGLARYIDQARTMAEDTLDAEPFLAELRKHVVEFTGTAAELLELVTPTDGKPRGWPNARAVTTVLKRNAPGLRKAGWTVEQTGRDADARALLWTLHHPEKVGKRRSERSDARETPTYPRVTSEPSDESAPSQDDTEDGTATLLDADTFVCSRCLVAQWDARLGPDWHKDHCSAIDAELAR